MKAGLLKVQLVLGAALLVVSLAPTRAEDASKTNTPPVRKESRPVKLDESAYRIVSDRNIFNANRSGGTVRSSSSRRPSRVDSFALVGTMAYEKGVFAFFEGSSAEYTKALKPDGIIAGYKLVDILANGVKLEMDGQITELAIGSGLRREDQGAWKMTESATMPAVSAGGFSSSNEADGRYNRNGRSRRGDDSERNGSHSSESAGTTAASTPPPSADQSDILKKLMERREKESQ